MNNEGAMRYTQIHMLGCGDTSTLKGGHRNIPESHLSFAVCLLDFRKARFTSKTQMLSHKYGLGRHTVLMFYCPTLLETNGATCCNSGLQPWDSKAFKVL